MSAPFDLTGIALVTTVALACGLLLSRLRQPPIVGYIVAGIVLGPTGLGLIGNSDGVRLLAELGVLMLLFLVGMELSVHAFRAVWRVALLTVLLQIVLSVAVTLPAGALLGWPAERSLVFGFLIALSGTAVAIKMLEEIGELKTEMGRVTVGVLVAQDLAFVPLLLVTMALAPGSTGIDGWMLAKLAGAVAVLGGLVALLGGSRRLPVPYADWFRRNPDAVPVAALGFCFSMASLSGLLGLSTAFGAFLAGFMLGNSTGRKQSLRATQPIQAVLVVVFFLSIGLLIDLDYVWRNLGLVLLFLLLVTLVKTAINVGVLHLLGEPWARAFPAGVVMGSLGEFSFVLATAGAASGVVDPDTRQLAVTVIALSWLASPLWLASARRVHDLAAARIVDGVVGLRALLRQVYSGELALLRRSWAAARRATARLSALRRRDKPAAATPRGMQPAQMPSADDPGPPLA